MKRFVIQNLLTKGYLSHYDEDLRTNRFDRDLANALTYNSKEEAERVLNNLFAAHMFSIIPVDAPFNGTQGLVQTQLKLEDKKEVKEVETAVAMCPTCRSTILYYNRDRGRIECVNCDTATEYLEDWDTEATKIEGEDENGKFIQFTVRL